MAEAGSTWLDLQQAVIDEMDQRTDLDDAVVRKLIEAIEFYQDKIFLADEAESQWTTCTIGVQTVSLPPNFENMDRLFVNIDGVWYPMEQKDQDFIETYNAQVPPVLGPPLYFAIYQQDPNVGQQINMAPVPDQAYQLKAIYEQIIPVPANDTTSNFWTTDGASMILHRAVGLLRMTVTRTEDLGQADFLLAQREYWRLKRRIETVQASRTVKPRYL